MYQISYFLAQMSKYLGIISAKYKKKTCLVIILLRWNLQTRKVKCYPTFYWVQRNEVM